MSQPIRARSSFRPGQIVQIVGTREIATVISADDAERHGSQYAHDEVNWDSVIVRLPSGEIGFWWSGNLVAYEPAVVLPNPLRLMLAIVVAVVLAWTVGLWLGGYL